MTGKGGVSIQANRVTRRFLVLAGIWALLISVLVAWWAFVLSKQAGRIAELEQLAGIASTVAHDRWAKTERMLFWESMTFLMLLAAVTVALGWLYWRDMRRTRALQAFFASVTHELKTPLTSIRLQSESIAEQGSSRPLVDRLLEDTSRLEAQVERTLELARVEGGGTLLMQSLPVGSWLERAVSALGRFNERKISFRTHVEPANLILKGDPAALQMILRNLTENSIRYAQKTPVEAKIEVREQSPYVVMTYSDDGKGFEGPGDKLGELFYRGEKSQGAGVGLYLVRMLMGRMSGKAVFESPPDGGFRARLWFRTGEE